MDTIKIVCIGHTTLDDIVISETGDTYFRQPGGGGLHSAAGAALWSSRKQVGVVTRLPGGFPPAPQTVDKARNRQNRKTISGSLIFSFT